MSARQRTLTRSEGRARRAIITGWALFGVSYAASSLAGAIVFDVTDKPHRRRWGARMMMPVAGPFAAAFATKSATASLFTVYAGLAQSVSLVTAVVGHIRLAKIRRERRRLSLTALPTRTGAVVTMGMRF